MRQTSSGGSLRRLVVGAACLSVLVGMVGITLPGCCSCPDAFRYFPRHTPFNALSGFVYGVETGQWDFVWDSLSAEDRKRDITALGVEIGLDYWILRDPRYGIPLKTIILDSRWYPERVAVREQEARVQVLYEGITEDGIDIYLPIDIYLVRESIDDSDELWRINFTRTIQQN